MWLVQLRLLDGASAVGTVIPPPAVGLPTMDIQNFYVVDFKSKRRRPLNDVEWKLVKQWARIYKRTRLRYLKDLSANRELERKAEAAVRGERRTRKTISDGARRAEAAEREVKMLRRRTRKFDPSGLRPVKRREMRRA